MSELQELYWQFDKNHLRFIVTDLRIIFSLAGNISFSNEYYFHVQCFINLEIKGSMVAKGGNNSYNLNKMAHNKMLNGNKIQNALVYISSK